MNQNKKSIVLLFFHIVLLFVSGKMYRFGQKRLVLPVIIHIFYEDLFN